jgi:hypothetical protein
VRLYADRGPRRVRQIVGDLLVVGFGYVVIAMALRLRDAISSLGEVGLQLDRSGRTVTQGADRAAETVEGVPGIGGALAAPFGTISGAGRQLSAAGEQVGDSVAAVAWLAPALLTGLVLGFVVFRYLPGRVRWMLEATEARRLLQEPDGAGLLAHRAVANRSLRTLRTRAGPHAARDLAEGRWATLAAIELDALGLDGGADGPST